MPTGTSCATGAPVEPAEYRSVTLPLRDGALLTKSAWADLDSFPLSTLEPYRSIVTRRSPAESRPPSIYSLVWRGRYYELWQRPAHPLTSDPRHVPSANRTRCPTAASPRTAPARSPALLGQPGRRPLHARRSNASAGTASREHARARRLPAPAADRRARRSDALAGAAGCTNRRRARCRRTRRARRSRRSPCTATSATNCGSAGASRAALKSASTADDVGRVKDQLLSIGGYAPVADVYLTPGVHTFALTYPHADLTPGSGDNQLTSLAAIALQPLSSPPARLLTVAPAQAREPVRASARLDRGCRTGRRLAPRGGRSGQP